MVLTLTACATLVVGSDSIAAIRQWAARAPQANLARIGARYDPLTGRYLVPSERTFRRVLTQLDVDALDAVTCEYTAGLARGTVPAPEIPATPGPVEREQRRAARRPAEHPVPDGLLPATALDGKALAGARTESGRVFLVGAIDHTSGAVLGQTQVPDKRGEGEAARALLTQLDLPSQVFTLDALHTTKMSDAPVLPSSAVAGWRDRAGVLVHLAAAIVLGAANLSEVEQLQFHHRPLFGPGASDSTARRTLAALDEATLAKIAKMRARVRRHVWSLLHLRPGGFPWLTVAGKRLCGWIVIDLDATIITSASKKAGAAVTFKKTYGFHPLAAWCANTTESLAMLLRPGNAGANTVADHITVLTDALAQIPGSSAAKILARVDGAGATHGLLEHLEALNTTRRTVRYTVGWTITEEDEKAIARLPEAAWETSVHQDGSLQEGYSVAELTGVNTRAGWPEGMRLIVRRVRPTRRHLKKLTDFEKKTGWCYCITATNIGRM